jgi:hypothetical protein
MPVDVFLCLNKLYSHMISVLCTRIPLQSRLSVSLTQKLLNILTIVLFVLCYCIQCTTFLTFTILKVGYLYEPWILDCVTTGCDLVLVQYCTAFVLSCLLLYSCFRWHWFIYVYQRIGPLVLVLMMIYRVIKKSLCT